MALEFQARTTLVVADEETDEAQLFADLTDDQRDAVIALTATEADAEADRTLTDRNGGDVLPYGALRALELAQQTETIPEAADRAEAAAAQLAAVVAANTDNVLDDALGTLGLGGPDGALVSVRVNAGTVEVVSGDPGNPYEVFGGKTYRMGPGSTLILKYDLAVLRERGHALGTGDPFSFGVAARGTGEDPDDLADWRLRGQWLNADDTVLGEQALIAFADGTGAVQYRTVENDLVEAGAAFHEIIVNTKIGSTGTLDVYGRSGRDAATAPVGIETPALPSVRGQAVQNDQRLKVLEARGLGNVLYTSIGQSGGTQSGAMDVAPVALDTTRCSTWYVAAQEWRPFNDADIPGLGAGPHRAAVRELLRAGHDHVFCYVANVGGAPVEAPDSGTGNWSPTGALFGTWRTQREAGALALLTAGVPIHWETLLTFVGPTDGDWADDAADEAERTARLDAFEEAYLALVTDRLLPVMGPAPSVGIVLGIQHPDEVGGDGQLLDPNPRPGWAESRTRASVVAQRAQAAGANVQVVSRAAAVAAQFGAINDPGDPHSKGSYRQLIGREIGTGIASHLAPFWIQNGDGTTYDPAVGYTPTPTYALATVAANEPRDGHYPPSPYLGGVRRRALLVEPGPVTNGWHWPATTVGVGVTEPEPGTYRLTSELAIAFVRVHREVPTTANTPQALYLEARAGTWSVLGLNVWRKSGADQQMEFDLSTGAEVGSVYTGTSLYTFRRLLDDWWAVEVTWNSNAGGGVEYVQMGLAVNPGVGQYLDVRHVTRFVDVGLVTSPIPTDGAPATRGAETATIEGLAAGTVSLGWTPARGGAIQRATVAHAGGDLVLPTGDGRAYVYVDLDGAPVYRPGGEIAVVRSGVATQIEAS